MLKLKLQYFGHLMWRTNSLEKTLMLGKIEGRRRRGRQTMRWLDGITTWWIWVWMNALSWWWTGKPGVLQSIWSQGVGHDWATELNWADVRWLDGITDSKCLLKCQWLIRWCHLTISSSVTPFSSYLQSFPASGSFPMRQFFTSGSKSIGVSARASVLPMNIQDWFPLGLIGWISLQSKGLSRIL